VAEPDPVRSGATGMGVAEEEEEPGLDPIPRFEARRAGDRNGRCPRCRGKGPVGKFCLTCVVTEIGRCPECETEGPLREVCWECARNEIDSAYLLYQEVGKCPECGDVGPKYHACDNCEDSGLLYENEV